MRLESSSTVGQRGYGRVILRLYLAVSCCSRFVAICLLAITLASISLSTALAAALPPGCQIFAGAKLVINGQQVFPDVPLLVNSSRMLVPIRIVAETLGAVVEWDGARRVASVVTGGRRIEMPIDSTRATIDGQPVTLDAPAVIYQSRTLVPLRFVAEALGCEVSWDAATATAGVVSASAGGNLLGVSLDLQPQAALLRVSTDSPVSYSVRSQAEPPRLIITLEGVDSATGWSEMPLGQALIDRVRVVSRQGPSPQVQLVCDLARPVRYSHKPASQGHGVELEISYQVNGVSWENGGVTVDASGPLQSTTFTLPDPHRFVIDLPGVILNGPANSFEVGRDGVVLVRYAQFNTNPDIVRVVLVLDSPQQYQIAASAGGLRIARDTAASALEYESTANGGRLTLRGGQATAQVAVSPDGRQLRVDVSGASSGSLEGATVQDGLVESYEILPVCSESFAVLVHLTAYGGHSLNNGGGLITLDIAKSSLAGRRIVLDPGHGGRDPGCTSVSGVHERELTLLWAEALRVRLESEGAVVRLTRDATTDFSVFPGQTMDAFERARIANDWDADVYVSIHFNAFTSSGPSGTEVFYHPTEPSSLPLAELMMEHLAKLGLTNRGAKAGYYAVLRETTMPAVMVEVGFLSNPGDEKFLLNPANQAKGVELMLEALRAYFR